MMGSNRNKKKQDLELFTNNKEEQMPDQIELESENAQINKPVKKKRKYDELSKKNKKVPKENEDVSELKKIRTKKRKLKHVPEQNSVEPNEQPKLVSVQENVPRPSLPQQNGELLESPNKQDSSEKKREELTWPEQDLTELISRMEKNIPDNDMLAYSTRAEKLDWNNVAFNNYNAEDCKKTWSILQKRIRRFRLLSEVLGDARKWVLSPKINHRSHRARKHPDMPRRPPSSYILFYSRRKDQIISQNPGLEGPEISKFMGQIFRNLPPEQREVYEKEAATSKELYLKNLKIFYEQHPEIEQETKIVKPEKEKVKVEKVVKVEKSPKIKSEKQVKIEKSPKPEKEKKKEEKPRKPEKEKTPKRCQTAFGLYFETELQSCEGAIDRLAYREKCKESWKQLPEKKKLPWILKAEEDLIRFNTEIKAYKTRHPEYQVNEIKSNLTKEEKIIKQRSTGKPIKPPNSAYGVFSKTMLQSEDIKVIAAKDRMIFIANKWKNADDQIRTVYRDKYLKLMEKYQEEYNAYLQTLPEEERKIEIEKSKSRAKPKNARKPTKSSAKPRPRRPENSQRPRRNQPKPKFKEPEQPPISPAKYFSTLYKGSDDPIQAWRALPSEEKRKYEEELTKKKQAYIVEFEKFLKSLTKVELEAFSKSRQQQMKSDDEDDDDDGSSECSSDSGDDHHENENGEQSNSEAESE